jgi:hypothetical protein
MGKLELPEEEGKKEFAGANGGKKRSRACQRCDRLSQSNL